MRSRLAVRIGPAVVLLATVLSMPTASPRDSTPLGRLGVPSSINGLVGFLEEGWGQAGRRSPASGEPWMDNTDLLNEGWKFLALRRDDIRADSALAARVSALSLRYAIGDPPSAIRDMVDEDLFRTSINELTQESARRLDYLQHNGMIALGIFGLPTDDLVEQALAVYEAEERPIVRVSYARTLGLLGWTHALEDLVDLSASEDRAVAVAAAQSLYFLTGRVFRMHAQMAIEPRREAADLIRKWWESTQSDPPQTMREMALERQSHGGPDTRPAPSSRLHADLRASAVKTDAADLYGSRTAWRRLTDQGPELAENLEMILKNPREDLDEREEAIRWYVKLRGDKAGRWLKRLRKDPNPEIIEVAKQMLDGLK